MRKKHVLKITTFLSILMFLLLPLLSFPVAAVFTYDTSSVASTNLPSEIDLVANCDPPYSFQHNGSSSATFECDYWFLDDNGGGTGSWHRATITVTGALGGSTATGWIFLSAGSGPVTGTITYGPISYSAPQSWGVEVKIECWDVSSGWGSLATHTDDCTVDVYI